MLSNTLSNVYLCGARSLTWNLDLVLVFALKEFSALYLLPLSGRSKCQYHQGHPSHLPILENVENHEKYILQYEMSYDGLDKCWNILLVDSLEHIFDHDSEIEEDASEDEDHLEVNSFYVPNVQNSSAQSTLWWHVPHVWCTHTSTQAHTCLVHIAHFLFIFANFWF